MIRNEFSKSLQERGIESKEVTDLFNAAIDLAGTMALLIPGPGELTRPFFRSVAETVGKKIFVPDRLHPGVVKGIRLYTVFLRVMTTLTRATAWLQRLLNFVFVMSLIPISCFVYIFIVYPEIPQSIGGGQPIPVIMILDTDKIPTNSIETQTLFPSNVQPSQNSKATTTVQLGLLYSTDNAYIVEGDKNMIISLSKDAVEGIIWRR